MAVATAWICMYASNVDMSYESRSASFGFVTYKSNTPDDPRAVLLFGMSVRFFLYSFSLRS